MQQKVLNFRVDGQFIRAPRYTVVADCKNYLRARFSFSEEWQDLEKTAVFVGMNGKAYHVVVDGELSIVPAEVIRPGRFLVSVFGGDRLTTDRAEVVVEASGCVDGITPPVPTPDVYAQLCETVATERQLAQAAAVTAGEKADTAQTAAVTASIAADDAAARANEAGFYTRQAQEAVETAATRAEETAVLADATAEYTNRAETACATAQAAQTVCADASKACEQAQLSCAYHSDIAAQMAQKAESLVATLETTLANKTAIKDWEPLADITLTEATASFSHLFEKMYTEVWVEGELFFESDFSGSKTGICHINGNGRGTIFAEYIGGITNGLQQFFNVHFFKSPSGAMVGSTTHGTLYYVNAKTTHSAGVRTHYGDFDRLAMSLAPETGNDGLRFAAGSHLKVWGR